MIDNNPLSFDIARKYFWMPDHVACIVDNMQRYLSRTRKTFDAIGVDVGGPCFDYDEALNTKTCSLLRGGLSDNGSIAINLACDWLDDDTPRRIGERLQSQDLNVWFYREYFQTSENVILFASPRDVARERIKAGSGEWRIDRR